MSEPARIRTAIIDDEPLARDGVRLLLERDAEIEIIGEAGGGVEALELLLEESPDLVFLDVEMPGMDGFELLSRLDRERLPTVVFISAHDVYAMQAFDARALDYLQKPYDDDRFFEALGRAKKYVRMSSLSALSTRLIELLESYGGERPSDAEVGAPPPSMHLRRIGIKSAGRVVYVDVHDIDWIEAADYYVQLHAGTVVHLHRQTMTSLERQLDADIFCRIHRSAIVNLTRVREVRHRGRRDMHVVLDGGIELKVARRHRDRLQRRLESRARG